MKKGRHRRFEEARALKRSSEPSFDGTPGQGGLQSRARSAGPTPATTTLPGAWSRRTKTTSSGPDVPASAPPPALLRSRTPLRDHPPPPSATSPSSPTSTTARPPSSTRCCAPPASSRAHQAARRPGHGLQRPGARAGHHHPRQGRLGHLEGRQDQPGRHARPRRLRRRGRAGPDHGRRRAAARRRGRGARCPRPATCCRRRSPCDLPAVVVSTRSTASDARADEVLDEIYQLFLDLDADDHHIEFPIVSAVAREGRAIAGHRHARRPTPTSPPLLDAILDTIPAPDRRSRRRRSRRSSPTSTPPTTSAASPSAASCDGTLRQGETGRAARRGGRRGPAAAQPPPRPSSMGFEGVGRDRGRRARSPATCSSSPGSPRSRSATPSPTRPTPRRCPG